MIIFQMNADSILLAQTPFLSPKPPLVLNHDPTDKSFKATPLSRRFFQLMFRLYKGLIFLLMGYSEGVKYELKIGEANNPG